ncbi:MAG TPA: ABC transporter permease [Thermoanaerobaculia bacterium]|nr:ABC transporter permease [Thermoanaerobaculia bacterium]
MIPLKYNIQNLRARGVSTFMSIFGIGIVIAVMLSMMALYNGVKKATTTEASKDSMMVLREGAQAEVSSWVTKEAYRIIRALPGIQKDSKGEPLISPEIVIAFKVPKKDNPKGANVIVRGVTQNAFAMRPYVRLIQGRMFRPATNELIVARRIRDRFLNCDIGDTFKFGPQEWRVVGVFDAPNSAFASEIWADVDFLGQARKRTAYSSLLIRPIDHSAFESIKAAIANDNRLKLQVKSESQYYNEQTNGLLGIVILVFIVALFMVAAAILATMNTMFAAVSSRKKELATLRAIGYKRRQILLAIVIESAFVAFLGGVAGILLSLPVNFISTGTINWQTFSEVAFNFDVDRGVALMGLILAVVSGVIGGFIPAATAARMPITQALREI